MGALFCKVPMPCRRWKIVMRKKVELAAVLRMAGVAGPSAVSHFAMFDQNEALQRNGGSVSYMVKHGERV
ncbi:hypothetical protein Sbs19_11910 [Sphingobium sp. BS19]|nr:hypothetical protein Sbs19_11910 [Sphingobium sp. BS19]